MVHESPRQLREVVVVGCGAIGLPLALAFAGRGRTVVGVDADPGRISDLSSASVGPDPERLDLKLRESADRLRFAGAVPESTAARAFVVAVSTPADQAGRFSDSALKGAAQSVVARAQGGDLIVIRSTVPIGTTRALAASLDPAGRLLWAACPDRSFAGRALSDQFAIPHIVGGLTPPAAAAAAELFEDLCEVVQVGSPETAEAAKLFLNVERDMRFAVANQFALICEQAGVDYSEARQAVARGSDFRLARPGPVGGPCLEKDAYLLLGSPGIGGTGELLARGRALNAGLARGLADQILAETAAPRRVAILGLAFKGSPPVTNRAGSFGLALGQALSALDPAIDIAAWDPVSDPPSARQAALAGAAVVVLANEHPDLADLASIASVSPGAIVHDLCGVTLGLQVPPGLRVRVFGDGAA